MPLTLTGRYASVLALLMAAAMWAMPKDALAKRPTPTHTVKAGETLGGIAKKQGCTIKQLKRSNRLKSDLIKVGQTLKLTKCNGIEGKDAPSFKAIKHIVVKGDSLSGISAKYDASAKDIRKRNKLKGNTVRLCQILTIVPGKKVEVRTFERYTIGAGDTLDRVARRYRTSLQEIGCLNPKVRKNPNRLRIGDRLKLMRHGPVNQSVAVGRPQDGKLVNGEQLPAGRGYYRRRPHLAWGTNETISGLRSAIEIVRAKHRNIHDVAVGDISAEHGGKLRRHKSHQSGRDVDLGLYFLKQKKQGPKAFISALRHKMDLAANWTLLKALVSTNQKGARVSYIFLDYRVQKELYQWAKKQGVKQKTLDWMFQYPRGRRAMRGIIRHEPGHADHYHIRFRCPPGDKGCI
ncbi:MAG: penicillin-insensitive murein endopeptidase [Myxococcota bacterium]